MPVAAELMTMWPVSSRVGNPRNNTPDVVDEIPLPPEFDA
jgi:putative SOS response-associated peptidase YedK